MTTTIAGTASSAVVAKLVDYLESGVPPADLFAEDAFCDLTFPTWRVQTSTAARCYEIRANGHPWPGTVRVERVDPTQRGFTIQWEERWRAGGQSWYCREMARVEVVDGKIVDFALYCTGDWDEARQRTHAADVTLTKP